MAANRLRLAGLALLLGLGSCSPGASESGDLPFPPERVMVQVGDDSPPELQRPFYNCHHYDLLDVIQDTDLFRVEGFLPDGPGRTLDVGAGLREMALSSPEFLAELFIVEDGKAFRNEVTDAELTKQLDQLVATFVPENWVVLEPGSFEDIDRSLGDRLLIMPISVWQGLVDLDDDVDVYLVLAETPEVMVSPLLEGQLYDEVTVGLADVGDGIEPYGRCAWGPSNRLQATAAFNAVSPLAALLGLADGSLLTHDQISQAWQDAAPLDRAYGEPGMRDQLNNRLVDLNIIVEGIIPDGVRTTLCVASNLARSGCIDLADGPAVLKMDWRSVTELYVVDDFLADDTIEHGDVYATREVLLSGEFKEKRPWTLTLTWPSAGDLIAVME